MTYNQLLNINKSNAQKEIRKVFGETITENSAYHTIYDLSEKEYRNSIELEEYIKTLINKAEFANMPEANTIKEALEHYYANEEAFNKLF